MKTRTVVIVAVVVAAVLAPMVMAAPDAAGPRGQRGQGGPEGMQGMRGGFGFGGMMGGDTLSMLLGRAAEDIGLTDSQRTKLEAIREENREKTQELQTAVRDATMALNEAVEEGNDAKITAAGKALGDAYTKQALHRAAVTKQVKAVLTQEQLTKLQDLRTQMRERMMQRRQEGGGPQAGQDQPRGQRRQQGQQ
ncbi:MAG TPA: Spy/CpxP family protein refolding chaperone [Anaerohalosphaeraceae bacterium]|nr:Spy/CpxP family protein refolding chaperone [Phycisphaerae bacterium]HOK95283.1 Spy/CpxP family protein refolding chaperone [Anaerohalosphaeraceae bacterium]HOL31866.1 Spy/CpxP family protein refolding chaperone [Anaerohalosphaeraceae bacterium]HOM76707.1 Spy/CpxP family protein refolding chaperone [Anaerohalosphaeraceae bacterium]HPC65321.1 Spy/CpxP family protein refolding chaperone [Anaerohalosphaeraceae bacterium]